MTPSKNIDEYARESLEGSFVGESAIREKVLNIIVRKTDNFWGGRRVDPACFNMCLKNRPKIQCLTIAAAWNCNKSYILFIVCEKEHSSSTYLHVFPAQNHPTVCGFSKDVIMCLWWKLKQTESLGFGDDSAASPRFGEQFFAETVDHPRPPRIFQHLYVLCSAAVLIYARNTSR